MIANYNYRVENTRRLAISTTLGRVVIDDCRAIIRLTTELANTVVALQPS